ncbi:MAG: 4Fe-4S dicluster domain-containing protein [Candidatus Heimdallarchaeota archaeon]|nr:4Fe-4S dicluster domain-containing protein [Candidatus Heimdallarchaeota archaeon]
MVLEVIKRKPLEVGDSLMPELKRFGIKDTETCFNCGMCSAVCEHSEGDISMPRKTIRLVQLGLEDKLKQGLEPWLCYYCGDCSDSCPRGADPAELMMGVRRYLTAEYDHSGKAEKLYTNKWASWKSIILWFLFPIFGLLLVHAIPWFGAEIVTDTVQLNKFAPVYVIWAGTVVLGSYKGKFLISGMWNMWRETMSEDATGMKIPFSAYIIEFKTLVTQIATQKVWKKCADTTFRWFKHFLLVTGYFIMFVLIFALLWWFQTDEVYAWYHPQRLLGYYATVIMIVVSIDMLYGRLRRKTQIHKYSHHTDWLFPIFIFLVAVTGILVNLFRIYMPSEPWYTYGMYVLHLMVASTMLSNEVGVGKWTHLFYRPMALYFEAVRKRARSKLLQ